MPPRRKDHHLDTLDSLIADSEDPVAVHWRRTLHLCALGVAAVAGFLGCVVIHQATSGEHVALGLPTVGGGQEQMLWAFVPGTGALIPLMVATLVGAVIARLLPEREQH